MDDATKAAADAALVESMVQQLRDCVSVGDEMTLDHAALIDDAADWIAGEPERVAAAREEQREALGISRWPMLVPFIVAMVRKLDANKPKKGGREGWSKDDPSTLVRRVIDEAEELEHAVDTQPRGHILAEAADVANMAMMVADASGALNDTPLAATPLADRIAETERALADAVAIAREFDARQQKAEARVAELEAQAKEHQDRQALWDEDASFYLQTLRQADRIGELEAERDALKAQVEAARKRCRFWVTSTLEYTAAAAQDILDAMDEAAR